MLGGIAGDIIGSVFEKRNHRSKAFEPFFQPQTKFTDDTVCIVAVAQALVTGTHPVKTLQDWGRRYWNNGGWGQRFGLWLADDDPQPYNSWGNGGAMRVSPVCLVAESLEDALDLAYQVTVITHDHPEGLRGAQATAMTVWLALKKVDAIEIRRQVNQKFGYDLETTVDAIRPTYRHSEAAHLSVPQALVCALESTSFEDAIRNAVSIGGDSDTIAAIAGAVAEARFGIPDEIAQKTWSYLPAEMRKVMSELYAVRNHARTE
ncbi:MAG: ADP-ribosylglycohydrolase family protein [Comamonadaceae bacterium]|nr:ADP-ribosylglycohydrolase family protein [Comamonadaceae bacterium]